MFNDILEAFKRVFEDSSMNAYYLIQNGVVKYPYWVYVLTLPGADPENGEYTGTLALSGWYRSQDTVSHVEAMVLDADRVQLVLNDKVFSLGSGGLMRCYVVNVYIFPDEDPTIMRAEITIEIKAWKGATQ